MIPSSLKTHILPMSGQKRSDKDEQVPPQVGEVYLEHGVLKSLLVIYVFKAS